MLLTVMMMLSDDGDVVVDIVRLWRCRGDAVNGRGAVMDITQ